MNRFRLVIAGGSGFLGSLLAAHFVERGWEVVVLTRHPGRAPTGVREVAWDGVSLRAWTAELEGACALVNLAGRSVNCRYHARNRDQMMRSRTESTRVLGQAIALCRHPPAVWLNASTATIYRHTYGSAWNENGEIGPHADAKDAFSIEVATAWERAFDDAPVPGVRKVVLRSAMVLGAGTDANNVFRVLRRLARWGLGGRMGDGRQYVSWIHEVDYVRAVAFLIERTDLSGVFNLAAPEPMPNSEVMGLFRRVCGAPLGIGLPAARWMLEVGASALRTETELIVKSRRVVSPRLEGAGFDFAFPRLKAAILDCDTRARGVA